MEGDMKSGFGSLPSPDDNFTATPFLSNLLPFPPDYYLSVGMPSSQPLPFNCNSNTNFTNKKGRETISDRTRSLQKLIPVNKRLKTADMLEEAYKYVKFLQAQLRALNSMPPLSTVAVGIHENSSDNYGVLGLLNRQQLLQVLLNSPSIQNKLYSQGLCVCSVEQLFAFLPPHSTS